MMKKMLLCAVVFALPLSVALGQVETDPVAPKISTAAEDARIAKILSKPVNFEFDETPAIDILDMIRDNYSINVLLDQSARDDSLTEDDLITFKARNIEMGAALKLMLQQRNATYLIRDGVLQFISKDVAEDPSFFTRKVINCRSLLQQIRSVEGERVGTVSEVISLNQAPQVMAQRGGAGGGVFQLVDRTKEKQIVEMPSTDDNEKADGEEKPKQLYLVKKTRPEDLLIGVIKTSIAPDSWDDTNGDGSIAFLGGCMIVHSRTEVVDQIERLLADLNETIGK